MPSFDICTVLMLLTPLLWWITQPEGKTDSESERNRERQETIHMLLELQWRLNSRTSKGGGKCVVNHIMQAHAAKNTAIHFTT
jgi:hypothetical protein